MPRLQFQQCFATVCARHEAFHSKENISEKYRDKIKEILTQHQDIYDKRRKGEGSLDDEFKIWEFKRVLNKIKQTAPGRDGIYYIMLKRANDKILKLVLDLIIKIGQKVD